jgi:hypothetical protein
MQRTADHRRKNGPSLSEEARQVMSAGTEKEVAPPNRNGTPQIATNSHEFQRLSVLAADHDRAQDLGQAIASKKTDVLENAAGSSGDPLPGRSRDMFESSLGADLSEVRIHTGPESADAAKALGARAFTVGQDIHFGQGRFAPDDAGGLHLLAHEVAHTRQQRGSTGLPFDRLPVLPAHHRAEADADQAAGRMIHGAPAAPGGAIEAAGVQRSAIDTARQIAEDLASAAGLPIPLTPKPFTPGVGAAPPVQTVKGGANSNAYIKYDGPAPGGPGEGWPHSLPGPPLSKSLTVDRGRSGTLYIDMATFWHTEGGEPYKADISDAHISAHFSCDEDGAITLSPPVAHTTGGGSIVEPFAETGSDGSRLVATAGVKHALTGSETGSKTEDRSSGTSNSGIKELAAELLGIGGKATSGVGHDKKEGEQRGNTSTVQQSGVEKLGFTREVSLIAGPRKLAPAALTVDNFAVNHSHVPPHATNALIGWWATVDPDVQAAIRNGTQGIRLSGYASKPGSEEHNLELSNERAKAIQHALEKIIGGSVLTSLEGFGSALATSDQEDPALRKVDLTVFNKKK